jgi:Major Facilitator Superfamily
MGLSSRLAWFPPARWLAALRAASAGRLAGLPAGTARRLALATFIDWAGTGVWLTTSTVLLVRVVHLRPTQVGLGLTAGGMLGLAAVWPVTTATRRWQVRRVAITVQLLRGLFFLGFLLVRSAPAYYLAAALVAVVDRPATSVNQVLVSRYVPDKQRPATLAAMHVAANAGMMSGALLASTALLLPSRASLDAVVVANSLSFVVAAWQVRRAASGKETAGAHGDSGARDPAGARGDTGARDAAGQGVGQEAADRAGPGSQAAAGPGWLTWRFGLLTVGCAALALLFPLFNVEIPLWLTTRTAVPAVTVSVLFALNTLLVVAFQARLTRRVTGIRAGMWAGVAAGACVVCCCGLLAVLPGLVTWAATGGFVLAAVLLTLGEMNAGSAAWTLSFGLSPPAETARSLALFNTGQASAFVLGPALCTSAVAWAGRAGFAILAAIVAVGACFVVVGSRSKVVPGSGHLDEVKPAGVA